MIEFIDRALPLLIALAGALVGYALHAREFSRDKRLQVYGDFVAAFLAAAHAGAVLFSMHTQLGERMFQDPDKAETMRFWDEWATSIEKFEAETVRLRLVGSRHARKRSERLEEFIESNVRHVPPFRRTNGTDGWGESAKVGPAKVESDALALSREFADRFAREIVGRPVAFMRR